MPATHLSVEKCEIIAAEAQTLSLRSVAAKHGINYMTVDKIRKGWRPKIEQLREWVQKTALSTDANLCCPPEKSTEAVETEATTETAEPETEVFTLQSRPSMQSALDCVMDAIDHTWRAACKVPAGPEQVLAKVRVLKLYGKYSGLDSLLSSEDSPLWKRPTKPEEEPLWLQKMRARGIIIQVPSTVEPADNETEVTVVELEE